MDRRLSQSICSVRKSGHRPVDGDLILGALARPKYRAFRRQNAVKERPAGPVTRVTAPAQVARSDLSPSTSAFWGAVPRDHQAMERGRRAVRGEIRRPGQPQARARLARRRQQPAAVLNRKGVKAKTTKQNCAASPTRCLADQCLHSAEADVRPPRRKSGFDGGHGPWG